MWNCEDSRSEIIKHWTAGMARLSHHKFQHPPFVRLFVDLHRLPEYEISFFFRWLLPVLKKIKKLVLLARAPLAASGTGIWRRLDIFLDWHHSYNLQLLLWLLVLSGSTRISWYQPLFHFSLMLGIIMIWNLALMLYSSCRQYYLLLLIITPDIYHMISTSSNLLKSPLSFIIRTWRDPNLKAVIIIFIMIIYFFI